MNLKKVCWFFLIATVFSCTRDKNPLNPLTYNNDYFPLQVGNEWSYEFFVWIPTGNDTMIASYKINGIKQVNGKEYYEFNYRMPFFPNSFEFPGLGAPLFRQDEKGNILTVIDNTEWTFLIFDNAPVDAMIKRKLSLLDHWIYIKSINKTVQTDVGLFRNCHKILSYLPQIMGSEYFIWFAPGYGPIKIWYPELNITYELIQININRKR